MKSFLLCIIGIVIISPLYSGSARAQVTVVSGYTVSQLATGIDRPWVAGGTSTNGYTGDLYVTTGSTQQIVRIDTSGTVTAFADLSAIVPFDATFWATFDLVGNYGGELFVDDDNIATHHGRTGVIHLLFLSSSDSMQAFSQVNHTSIAK